MIMDELRHKLSGFDVVFLPTPWSCNDMVDALANQDSCASHTQVTSP